MAPSSGTPGEVEVEGRRLVLSNLDKVFWPQVGFTKGDMIGYYRSVAPALLPHLRGRALTLRRSPDGVEGWYWFQNRCPHPPPWMRTEAILSSSTPEKVFRYCVVDDLASLLWVANLASIELHPLLSSPARPAQPSALVFDLDPGPPAHLLDCCRVALRLRHLLGNLGLASFAKTSGASGLHVYVPLNKPHAFEDVKPFARRMARVLMDECPQLVVDRPGRSVRRGKVLVDWSQNNSARSMVAAYSLRATQVPSVSTPVGWPEVEQAVKAGDSGLLRFGPAQVLQRVGRLGEIFRPVLELKQQISS